LKRAINLRTRTAIRRLFAKRRLFTVTEAAQITGISPDAIRRRLDANELAAVSGTNSSLAWTEVVHLALQMWPIEVIFAEVGSDSALLPALLRPAQLSVSLPEYQVRMVEVLARREQLDSSVFLQNYLLDLASASDHDLLERKIPGFTAAMRWPDE